MNGRVDDYYDSVQKAKPDFKLLNESIEKAAQMIARSLKSSGTVFICGNGGSAADAQHIAGELVGRYLKERKAYKAVALSTDTSIITAVGNDYGYDEIFKRQISGLGRKGDVLIGISTSGNSANVVKAVEAAKETGIFTVGFLGKKGSRLSTLVDLPIFVQAEMTPVIQVWHSIIYHTLCHRIEELMEAKDI